MFLYPRQAADELAVVIEPLHAVGAELYLRKGKDAARDGKTQEFKFREMFAAVRIALLGYGSPFHAAYAAGNIESRRESACRILVLRNIAFEEVGCIDVRSQSACRQHRRHSVVVKLLDKILYEHRSLADDLHIHRLLKTDGHSFHRAHLHASICQEALEQRHIFLHLGNEIFVVGADGTTS